MLLSIIVDSSCADPMGELKLFFEFSVNLMAFVCGPAFVWTSPFLPKLNGSVDPEKNPFSRPTTPLEDSIITSLMLVGAVCSPFFTGPIANKYGKKRTLLAFMVFPTISNIIMVFATNPIQMYVARFLMGLGTGCVFTLIPIYVAEISDTSNRGATSIIMTLMITCSQLMVYIIGPYVTIRSFAMILLVPTTLFLITFGIFAPESSYHLILHNQQEEAKMALKKLSGRPDVEKDILEISLELEETKNQITFASLRTPKVTKCLRITLGLLFFQVFSGVLPIQCYSQTIFASAGGFVPADKSAMLGGAVSVIVTLLFVKIVDLFGRKTLLIFSYVGALVSMILLGTFFYLQEHSYDVTKISWLPVVSVLAFLFSFCMGAGPLPWTLIGELFPPNLKSYLSAVASSFMFLLNAILTLVFPLLSAATGMAAVFFIFALFVATAIVFTIYFVPETKGRSLQEIQYMLEERNDK